MRYFLDPFGCVKNQVDTENMMAHLNSSGWENAEDAEHADLIIVNSCGFIESAKQESINAVLEWRKHYPNKKILLAGCLAQRYEKELSNELTEADGFMGVEDITQIVEKAGKLIKEEYAEVGKVAATQTGERPLLSLPGSAYVKISEGCNNNCSYCAIPLIRGGLRSRAIPDILDECRTLLTRGIKELCIIGQDIGAFGMDFPKDFSQRHRNAKNVEEEKKVSKLPELLQAIATLEGDFWVRLLYIHPDHFPLQILDLMEKDKRFLPYFDIPFQHASAKILAAMNRTGLVQNNTAEKYLELLQTIRTRLPDAVLRSTFLLGFPGETDEDFDELLVFQQQAKLDWLGCFTYSREEGTGAYSMKKQVKTKIAEQRKALIEEKQIPIMEKNMERFTGLTLDVLIEEQIDEYWLGRLYCQAPEIDGTAVIVNKTKNKKILQAGLLYKCKVIARRGFDLEVCIDN